MTFHWKYEEKRKIRNRNISLYGDMLFLQRMTKMENELSLHEENQMKRTNSYKWYIGSILQEERGKITLISEPQQDTKTSEVILRLIRRGAFDCLVKNFNGNYNLAQLVGDYLFFKSQAGKSIEKIRVYHQLKQIKIIFYEKRMFLDYDEKFELDNGNEMKYTWSACHESEILDQLSIADVLTPLDNLYQFVRYSFDINLAIESLKELTVDEIIFHTMKKPILDERHVNGIKFGIHYPECSFSTELNDGFYEINDTPSNTMDYYDDFDDFLDLSFEKEEEEKERLVWESFAPPLKKRRLNND